MSNGRWMEIMRAKQLRQREGRVLVRQAHIVAMAIDLHSPCYWYASAEGPQATLVIPDGCKSWIDWE